MAQLSSCFLAIPVPERLYPNLKKLQVTTKKLLPGVEFVSIPTSHITLYYLGDVEETNVETVVTLARKNLETLKESTVRLQYFGAFGDPLVNSFHLLVETQSVVFDFVAELRKNLESQFAHVESLLFKPHVTIGYCSTPEVQNEFRFHRDYLTRLLAGVKWDFPITELVLFGRLPGTKMTEPHTRIASIPVA